MSQHNPFQRQVSAAIIQLRLRSPFFATLALFARIVPSETLPTAATDGRDIFINPKFWRELTAAERLGVFAHEVLHAALLHVPRRGVRDPLLWNIAADIVVNGIIMAEEGFALPEGHLRDKNLEHLSAEEIYSEFQKHPELCKLLKLLFSDLLLAPDGTYSHGQYAELEQHWRQALEQGRMMSEMVGGHGNVPAGLRRELRHLSPAQLDWRAYLWRFLVQTPNDFQGFDRRFVGRGLYLDDLAGEKLRVFICVDTSGSIGGQEIGQFLGEVQAILGSYPHLEANLYYADAACYGPYELTASSEIPTPRGGGGTDFRPFFQELEKLDQPTSGVCVYLTDGYGTFPAEEPSIPTLWVLSAGGLAIEEVPFGEAARLIADV